MTNEAMLERLIENAIDFLSNAVDQLGDQPKYSIISFHSAVELFLKARLMAEHWTLVVGKRQEPDWGKFESGDFQSVSLEEAAARLEKVVKSGLSRKELEVFREVSTHRNKTVHFYHEAHSDEEKKAAMRAIVQRQLVAWYLLHRLLIEQWEDVFSPWAGKIADIDQKLRGLHEFLSIIFENEREHIAELEAQGMLIRACPSCGFASQVHDYETEVVYVCSCVVCGLKQTAVQIFCPDCNERVFFEGEGYSTCTGCDRNFEPDELVSVLTDEGAEHVAAMEGDDSYDPGNCSDCDGYHTVIHTETDQILCLNCFGLFETMGRCGWCNEPNTGNMENSYWAGCNHCDGRAGWDRDD